MVGRVEDESRCLRWCNVMLLMILVRQCELRASCVSVLDRAHPPPLVETIQRVQIEPAPYARAFFG